MIMARQSDPSDTPPGIPVLVTRPQAEAEAFATELTARFGPKVRPVVTPLLAPRCLSPELPTGDFGAVVFTSAQAVEAALPFRPKLPTLAWCVGKKTAMTAMAAGFRAKSADGDAEGLLAALSSDPPTGSILYLRGVDTAFNLLERLGKMGISGKEAVVYIQDRRPLSPEASDLLQLPRDIIVPLFSPRTARLFRAALPLNPIARLHIAALSARVAQALGDTSSFEIAIAQRPDAPAMLDTVESLLVAMTPP